MRFGRAVSNRPRFWSRWIFDLYGTVLTMDIIVSIERPRYALTRWQYSISGGDQLAVGAVSTVLGRGADAISETSGSRTR